MNLNLLAMLEVVNLGMGRWAYFVLILLHGFFLFLVLNGIAKCEKAIYQFPSEKDVTLPLLYGALILSVISILFTTYRFFTFYEQPQPADPHPEHTMD